MNQVRFDQNVARGTVGVDEDSVVQGGEQEKLRARRGRYEEDPIFIYPGRTEKQSNVVMARISLASLEIGQNGWWAAAPRKTLRVFQWAGGPAPTYSESRGLDNKLKCRPVDPPWPT